MNPTINFGFGRPAATRDFAEGGHFPSRKSPLPFFLIVLSGMTVSLFAQSYSIDWHKIAGGGGTSTGGVYSVSGTIGQPDAGGPMTGGSYSLTGGFWSLISVVQTSNAPPLAISHSGSTVTVYWHNISGWTLQQNSSVTAPLGWSASSGVTTANGTNYLNLASPTGHSFFRLSNH
jgi:hypothetical protein